MFCKNCGTKLNENSNFCSKCGTSLGNDYIKLNKSVLIGIILLILSSICIIIIACQSNSNNSIVGTWVNPNSGKVAYEFFEDGTFGHNVSGKYYEATSDGELTYFDSYHYPIRKYNYKIIDDKLYIYKKHKIDEEYIKKEQYYIRKSTLMQ